MTYVYEASHEHTQYHMEYDSLAEAILSAAIDLELGYAWPIRITDSEGVVMWEQCGPLKTTAALEKLAQDHGVEWPVV